MARPTVAHQGFLVPNAQDVAKPELAEPDRIDFNTVAHTRWGVLTGCLVTVTTSTATNTAGTALVNGKLVDVSPGQNVSVGAGGSQDRFDIVGVNSLGILVALPGTESLDPVFPDVPLDVTALAAVLCTAGGGNYSDNVIDKRKLLADSLLTKIPAANDLIVNRNGSGNFFKIDGEGTTSWLNDTILKRHDIGTLRVQDRLLVDDTIVAGGTITTAKSLVAGGRISGSNFRNAATLPSNASGVPGDIFANNGDGRIYVHTNGVWEELATVKASIPMGAVITSLQKPESMPSNWIPLDGAAQVLESTHAALFALLDSWNWPRSGIAPNRVITTVNSSKRMLMVDFAGTIGAVGGSSSITLGIDNLPQHKHNARALMGGGHQPTITINQDGGHRHVLSGGEHGHPVSDPGHQHFGADHILGGGFICAAWGGRNKIDAYFNDRSHTYSVEMAEWTRAAYTGISIGSSGSAHGHEISYEGQHGHGASVSATPQHDHPPYEEYVGNGTPLQWSPSHLTVYCYIRA